MTRPAKRFSLPELKEGEIAAQIILAEPTAFRGEKLSGVGCALARSLEQGQPLAGSIVLSGVAGVDSGPGPVQKPTRTRPATCAAWASWLKRSARGRRLHP